MASRGYIPRPNPQFNDWFKNLVAYVQSKATRPAWTHIPAQETTALVATLQDWTANYTPTLGTHTPGQRVARNDSRRRTEAIIIGE